MVFSDDFLYFLKIKKNNCPIHQNYLVAFKELEKKWRGKKYELSENIYINISYF